MGRVRDWFYSLPSRGEVHPSDDGIERSSHARDHSSNGAIQSRCMVTLANSQGGCDQDRRELSDAVKGECLEDLFAADTPSPWRRSKGTSRAGLRQMDPFSLSWHALSLRKGMLPSLEHEGANRRRAPRGFGRVWAGRGRHRGSLESVPRDHYRYHPSGSPPIAQTKPNTRLAESRGVYGPPQRSKALRGDAGITGCTPSSCEM
jgi:hypothetical protein